MTVGELVRLLSRYNDDDIELLVRVQSPDGKQVWDIHPCLGEDEFDHVYVMATGPNRSTLREVEET